MWILCGSDFSPNSLSHQLVGESLVLKVQVFAVQAVLSDGKMLKRDGTGPSPSLIRNTPPRRTAIRP